MVAWKGRASAVALVVMLVASAVVITVPEEAAAVASGFVVNLTVPAGTATPWPAGTTVTATVVPAAITVPNCGAPNPTGLQPTGADVVVDIGNALRANDDLTIAATVASGAINAATGTFTLGSSLSPGIEGTSVDFLVTITWTGCAVAPTPASSTGRTNNVNVDTKPPALNSGATLLGYTAASNHVPVAGDPFFGIGAQLSLVAGATDGGSGVKTSTLTLDYSALPGGPAGATPIPTGSVAYTVPAGSIDGSDVVITFNVQDNHGNIAPAKPVTLKIDNKAPTDPIVIERANLTRTPDGAFFNLDLGAGVGAAAIFAESNGVEDSIAVGDAANSGLVTFGADWDHISDPITVEIFPADLGGNVNLGVDPVAPSFPDGITLQLNGQALPVAAMKGNEIRNVYLNVTTNFLGVAPIYPTQATNVNNSNTLRVFGELVRVRPIAPTHLYWKVGTTGNDLNKEGAGDFQDYSNAQVGDGSPDEDGTGDPVGFPTTFTPGSNAPGCSSSVACYLFGNLTGKTISDGKYEMRLTVTGNDPLGSRTTLVHRMTLDSNDTKIDRPRNYTAGKGVPSTVSSVVHGGDGNPIRVLFNATDSIFTHNPVAGYNVHDSGLRNVTVELVSNAASTLVLNTSRSSSLPTIERAARVDITRASCTPNWDSLADRAARTLPYCHDLTDWATASAATLDSWCPGVHDATGVNLGAWNRTCYVYDDVVVYDRHRGAIPDPASNWFQNHTWTFMNATTFSGWVNVSMDDLPAGNYSVRLLAYDNTNRSKAEVYGSTASDLYKVAPVVRLQTGGDTPRITADNRLAFEVYGMQRYAPPVPADVSSSCVAGRTSVKDICPPGRIRIFLSNSEAATSNNGAEYITIQSFAGTPTTLPDFVSVSTMNTANGDFNVTGRSIKVFKNATFTPPVISLSGLDLTRPVFMRAVAESADGLTSNSTGWIRVASANAASLRINSPMGPWGIYADGAKPALNVSFNRTTDLPAPTLSWWLYEADVPFDLDAATAATFVASGANLTRLNSGSNAPKVVFNWTDVLDTPAGAALPPGEYRLNVIAYDPTSTASSIIELGSASQTFSIVEPQSITIGDLAGSEGVFRPASSTTHYTASTFEVPFTVDHSFANLTDASQLKFRLTRAFPRPGQPNLVTPGQDGFTVDVRAESVLGGEQTETTFVATIRLPNGAIDGDSFRLNITAETDAVPFGVGNITRIVEFTHDKIPAAGGFLVRESEQTVFDFTTEKNKDSPAPAFVGFGEDLGSGIGRVEVRIFDVTENETLNFTTASPRRKDGLTNDWATTTGTTGPLTLGPASNGRRSWTLTPAAGSLDMRNTYRIDVRLTDNLGQRSEINTTIFDFDAAPPMLGYGGRLDTTASMRSGIILGPGTTTTIPWHGEGVLNVRVSDNFCIATVHLKGYHESNPSEIVTAQMEPERERCYSGYNTATADSSRRYQVYTIDLSEATNLTDKIGNYTYWFEATDVLGQTSEIPTAFRLFKMLVVDESPATVSNITFDPPVGQIGGRAAIRADIFDNQEVARVTVAVRNASGIIATAEMRATEAAAANNGTGQWTADTTDDLGIDLAVGNYTFLVTAYDVNWNRTEGGAPTCEDGECTPVSRVFAVRDDGIPSTSLRSPTDGAVVNATPTFELNAQHKALETSGIRLVLGVDGVETTVPAADIVFTELIGTTGARQGWNVKYAADTLPDAANLTLNVTLNVGGLIDVSSYTFRVDALPPTVDATVAGTVDVAGKTWAVSSTQVTLTAADNVSSTTRYYTVNGGPQQTYANPITPSGDDGLWTLEYWAADAANNVAAKKTLTLNLDRNGPRIAVVKHGDEIVLTVTDTGAGLNESSVVVHYRYGEAVSFATKAAEKLSANSFTALLPGNATESGLAYYFSAVDVLGNQGSNYSIAQPYTIARGGGNVPPSNLEPTISITAPTQGASPSRTFDLKWLAEDPEGAPLVITIALRDPAPGKLISANGDNSGTYRMNLSGSDYPAGAYTIVVTASDGEKSASDTVTFNLEAGEAIKPITVPPPTVQPNQQVSIGVSIAPAGKTVLQASYRVIKDGELYTSGRLTATQGAYGAAFTPTDSGEYRVLVDVAYSDGSTDASKQVAAFSVAGDGGSDTVKVFPGSLIALVAIAALTVALAAYGAFGRWKK